jgi:hypothetical protein
MTRHTAQKVVRSLADAKKDWQLVVGQVAEIIVPAPG